MATRSWNKAELIGNLTRDPELRYTPSGTAVCSFSIATNRSYISEGERKEEVDFHRIVAWGKLAELCSQLLKKGNRAFVSGRIQNRSWEGQDGVSRQTTEIVIDDMLVLTSRNGSYEQTEAKNGDQSQPQASITSSSSNKSDSPSKTKAPEESPVEQSTPKETTQETVNDEDLPF